MKFGVRDIAFIASEAGPVSIPFRFRDCFVARIAPLLRLNPALMQISAGLQTPPNVVALLWSPESPGRLTVDQISHDGPCLGTPGYFQESSLPKNSRRAMVGKQIRHIASLGLNGITFEDSATLPANIINHCLDQLRANAPASVSFRNEEADYRPDRLVIHRFEDSGSV